MVVCGDFFFACPLEEFLLKIYCFIFYKCVWGAGGGGEEYKYHFLPADKLRGLSKLDGRFILHNTPYNMCPEQTRSASYEYAFLYLQGTESLLLLIIKIKETLSILIR